jgi:hypothetical protein
MRSIHKGLLLLLLIFDFAILPTQTRSDDAPDCTKQGVGKLQLTIEDTTILGLTIGSASLKDIGAKLGQAQLLPDDGSGSVTASRTICFVSPADGTVLTFGAGPMGGFVDVTEFSIWSREAKFPNASACDPLELVSRGLSTTSGIRLGLSVKQMNDIIGKRGTSRRAVVHYEMGCRRKRTPDEVERFKRANNSDTSEYPYFDVTSFVDVHFTSAGASRIDIAKVESY